MIGRLGFWLRVGGLAAAAGLLGLAAVLTGVLPLSAAEGHWPLTEWLLEFTKTRTIAAKAWWIEPPPLDDPALVLRGAGHYDLGCRPCHGAPGEPPPRLLTEMTPDPPFLPTEVREWRADELFWIVQNGIKTTGMPGWPVRHREDEVWAMVAFLLRIRELGPEEYRRLARNEEWRPEGEKVAGGETAAVDAARPLEALTGDPPEAVLDTCRRCHGEDGRGRGVGAYPRLAGQHREYLLAQLVAYASGERPSGTMGGVAAELDRRTMAELAAWYAAQPPGPPAGVSAADAPTSAVAAEVVPEEHESLAPKPPLAAVDADALDRGRAIATVGIPERRIPACVECHGPVPGRRNPHYPLLAGQPPEYLLAQLDLFASGYRGGSRYAHLMEPVAHRLEEREMRDVAFWFATQPAASPPAAPPPAPR